MLRQAVSLFTYRKKSTGLLILLIALVAFLMMSIAPLFPPLLISHSRALWRRREGIMPYFLT